MTGHLPHTKVWRVRAATLTIATALALMSGLSLSAGTAPIRLVGVTAEGSALLIESSEPAAYAVKRPDPLTLLASQAVVPIDHLFHMAAGMMTEVTYDGIA